MQNAVGKIVKLVIVADAHMVLPQLRQAFRYWNPSCTVFFIYVQQHPMGCCSLDIMTVLCNGDVDDKHCWIGYWNDKKEVGDSR